MQSNSHYDWYIHPLREKHYYMTSHDIDESPSTHVGPTTRKSHTLKGDAPTFLRPGRTQRSIVERGAAIKDRVVQV
jgi:hypothetical protein